jgi:hypothetical protein
MTSVRIKIIRTVAVGSLSMTAAAAVTTPASAAQTHAIQVAAATRTATTGPNTNIKGKPPKWNPVKLTVPPTIGTCSTSNYSFTIDNQTKTAQTILYKTGKSSKKTLTTLNAGAKDAICVSGPKGSSAKLYIKGATSILTETLS